MNQLFFKNVVIGFGKAGKILAKDLASRGESVALIEKSTKMYGGTCINTGCIPSKSLIVNGEKGVPFEVAVKEKSKLVSILNQKNYHMVADEKNAKVIDGHAKFISNYEVEIQIGPEEFLRVRGERFFINTGASAVIPSIPGLLGNESVITSSELLDIQNLPKKLVIIGSGYIGTEFASMFVKYGSDVTVLDIHDNFLPKEDEDIAARVKSDLESEGVRFKLGIKIEDIDGKNIKIVYPNGEKETISASKILIATGRKPNTENLGLENTAINIGKRGEILVDDILETSVPNIWAMGDVHGGSQFTYTSLDDFRIIINQLYGSKERKLSDRTNVPNTIFTSPTLSSVGLNEKTAKLAGVAYRLFKLEATAIPKAAILGQQKGVLKALVSEEGKILGATLYSAESHEVINLLSLVIKAEIPYTLIRDHIFTHPTMSESLNDLFADTNEIALN